MRQEGRTGTTAQPHGAARFADQVAHWVVDQRRSRTWTLHLIALAVLLIGAGVLWAEPVIGMVNIWSRSPTFNHQFLILPISMYLVWERRQCLAGAIPRASVLGVLLVAIASVMWLSGRTANVAVVQHFAVV